MKSFDYNFKFQALIRNLSTVLFSTNLQFTWPSSDLIREVFSGDFEVDFEYKDFKGWLRFWICLKNLWYCTLCPDPRIFTFATNLPDQLLKGLHRSLLGPSLWSPNLSLSHSWVQIWLNIDFYLSSNTNIGYKSRFMYTNVS